MGSLFPGLDITKKLSEIQDSLMKYSIEDTDKVKENIASVSKDLSERQKTLNKDYNLLCTLYRDVSDQNIASFTVLQEVKKMVM